MAPERSDLAGLQRWMQSAILDPAGGADGAAEVLTASAALTARQRLGIYWRGYRLRLLENMRGLHPGLAHLLGTEMFDRFALDYLDAHPPRAYTLFELDKGFVDHLIATRPDVDRRPGWPDLIIDLARLERITTEVIEGPGTEDGPVLRPEDLPGPAALTELCLATAPCLRLPRLRFPANEYLAAVRRGEDPEFPRPRPVRLVVNRQAYQVTMRELTPADHRALRALARGATAGTALADRPADQTRELLRRWTELGFFTHIHPSGARPSGISPAAETVPVPPHRAAKRTTR
jgi:hypothetical protein